MNDDEAAAEIERLRAELDRAGQDWAVLVGEASKLRDRLADAENEIERLRAAEPKMADTDDGGPFFRAYALKVGDALTEQDVADIQKVLADLNDEIGKQTDIFHEARYDAFREIGGDALAAAVEAKDSALVSAAVEKALALFNERTDALRNATTDGVTEK